MPTHTVATVSCSTARPGARRLEGFSKLGVTPGGGARAGALSMRSEDAGMGGMVVVIVVLVVVLVVIVGGNKGDEY